MKQMDLLRGEIVKEREAIRFYLARLMRILKGEQQ